MRVEGMKAEVQALMPVGLEDDVLMGGETNHGMKKRKERVPQKKGKKAEKVMNDKKSQDEGTPTERDRAEVEDPMEVDGDAEAAPTQESL